MPFDLPALYVLAPLAVLISGLSKGGMKTKLIAASIAMAAGVDMAITLGTVDRPLTALSQGARATWFLGQGDPRAAALASSTDLSGAGPEGSASDAPRTASLQLILLLAAVTAIGPFAMQAIAPALPTLSTSLQISASAAKDARAPRPAGRSAVTSTLPRRGGRSPRSPSSGRICSRAACRAEP